MKAMPNTSRTSVMLAADIVTPTFDARDLPAIFGRVCGILTDEGLDYAAAGRLVLGRYRPAQCTEVIVLRIGAVADRGALRSRLEREACEGRATSTVRLEIGFVAGDLERRLLDLASRVEWLGAIAMVAAPEHLLWLALSTEDMDAATDAVHLLQTPHINWDRFVALGTMGDPDIARRGRKARRKAKATRHSTWSTMIEKRMAAYRPENGHPAVRPPPERGDAGQDGSEPTS